MSYTDTDSGNLLSLFGELKIHLGGISSAIRDSVDWQKRAKRYDVPISTKRPYSLVMPASGLGEVDLGGPNQGRVWNVRSITVSGTDPSVAVTGRLDVYVTGSNLGQFTALSSIGTADWRDYSSSLPSVAFYGVGEMRVLPNERLRLIFSTVAGGTNLSGSILVEDFEDASLAVQMAV